MGAKHLLSSLAITVLLLLSPAAHPQSYPANQQPMYGGIRKSESMRYTDRAFIKRILAMGVTRKQGARKMAELGFRYFSKSNFAAAMKRFNQAWLLDPNLGAAYHGYALVLIERDRNIKGADRMFRRAIAALSTWGGAFADYGRFLLLEKRLPEAISVLGRGLARYPNQRDLRGRFALALFVAHKYKRGCAEARRALPNTQRSERRTLLLVLKSPKCVGH